MPFLSDILGGAKSSITNGASSYVSQIAQGDLSQLSVSGVLNALTGAVGNAATSAADRGSAAFGDAMAGMNARGDAMQNWCWYALMPTITNSNAASVSGLGQPSLALPWYYVEDATLPSRLFSMKPLERNGGQANYVDGYSVGELTMSVYLDSTNKALMYFKAWQGNMMGNKDASKIINRGAWGYSKDYKKDITIVVMDVTKKTLITAKYFGCVPKDLAALTLSSGAAERLKQPITFSVDDVDITLQDASGLLKDVLNTAIGYGLGSLQGISADALGNFNSPNYAPVGSLSPTPVP